MTTPRDALENQADDLQFDEAEYVAEKPAGPSCGSCRSPIAGTYFAAAGSLYCDACRRRIESSARGGSRLGRVVKAFVLGSIAAIVGGLVYYGITHATGWNIGLVSVVVGVMIGGAVKSGSGNMGGRFYQFLAAFLTYTAIAGMIVPDLVAELREMSREEEAEELKQAAEAAAKAAPPIRLVEAERTPAGPAGLAARDANGGALADLPDQVFADADPVAAEPDADGSMVVRLEEEPAPSLAGLLLGLGVFIGVAYALPILAATQSPISGLIYGFAVWEAWKINRLVELDFQGPYVVETRADEHPVGGDGNHGA